jgi:hypothetical protein
LKFDIYSDKTLKVALGIRETGTTAENGANGGTTGTIEYVGAGTKQANGCPNPSRTVNANTWTTLEFDLPSEPKVGFTGNGSLDAGQQVLEHLVLVGAGGTGAYTVYVDNFNVVTTTALPGTVTMKANSTLTFTASATDPDPGDGVSYALDADTAETLTATIDSATGAFSWTPTASGTSDISVTAQDSPNNGAVSKSDTKTLTVVVNSDTLAPQGGSEGSFVAGGDSVTLTWDSAAGACYTIQYKAVGGSDWSDVSSVTANASASSAAVTNNGTDGYYRIVEMNSSGSDQ